MKTITTTLFLLILFSCSDNGTDYVKFKNSQDYTVPVFTDSFNNKTALFIFPHPDDEVVCAGTIAHLKKKRMDC